MKEGQKVIFLGSANSLYDRNGELMYQDLHIGDVYTIEESGTLCITILGKLRLKEFFTIETKWTKNE